MYDRTANNHKVILVGSPFVQGGKIHCLGSGMYGHLGVSAAWAFPGPFTVEILGWEWSTVSAVKTVFSHGGGTPNWSWYVNLNGSTELDATFSLNGTAITQIIASMAAVSANTPYAITLERNAANKMRLYLGGLMLGSATFAGTLHSSADPLILGKLTPGSSFGAGLGRWKDFRVTEGLALYDTDTSYTVPTTFPQAA